MVSPGSKVEVNISTNPEKKLPNDRLALIATTIPTTIIIVVSNVSPKSLKPVRLNIEKMMIKIPINNKI